jgi:hypothetical protein
VRRLAAACCSEELRGSLERREERAGPVGSYGLLGFESLAAPLSFVLFCRPHQQEGAIERIHSD